MAPTTEKTKKTSSKRLQQQPTRQQQQQQQQLIQQLIERIEPENSQNEDIRQDFDNFATRQITGKEQNRL